MHNQIIKWLLAMVLVVAMIASTQAQEWAIKANYTESCCCNPTCPCAFGSPPTLGHCDVVTLFEIEKGHYGNTNLDGVSIVMTSRFLEWIKYSVNDDATDEQAEAASKLITAVFGMADVKVLSSDKVPISIERTADKVKFSVPSSTVEIEMMKGWGGKPIKIQNIPVQKFSWPLFEDYTQYKSIALSHQSEDKKFSYTGTNGFTAKIDATSKK